MLMCFTLFLVLLAYFISFHFICTFNILVVNANGGNNTCGLSFFQAFMKQLLHFRNVNVTKLFSNEMLQPWKCCIISLENCLFFSKPDFLFLRHECFSWLYCFFLLTSSFQFSTYLVFLMNSLKTKTASSYIITSGFS